LNRFEFLQKVLAQLNEVQTALNTLYAQIKVEIQNERKVSSETVKTNDSAP